MGLRIGRLPQLPASLLALFGGALLLRLLLLPFIHPWDGNTFHNLFAQLAANENPYVTFWELTLQARTRTGEGYGHWYEYYAYPPALIYLYWLPAKLASLVVPLAPQFYPAGSLRTVPNVFPLAFLLLYKLPIWAADLAVGWMLWRRTSSVGVAAAWLLNPLVLLVSGAWMFDSIPAAMTLAAFLAFEKDRLLLSGALLAAGFATKYYPLFLLPALALPLVWRRDPRVFGFVGVFALVSLALVAPFLPEFARVLEFNAGREGGGLSAHQLVQSHAILTGGSLAAFKVAASPALGALLLVGGMALAYWALDRARPSPLACVTTSLLAFLLCSKVVNEQYVLWLLPFLLLALHEARHEPGARLRRVALNAVWAVPFAYALVHVPVTAFVPGGHPWTAFLVEQRTFNAVAAALAALLFMASVALCLHAFRPRRAPAEGGASA